MIMIFDALELKRFRKSLNLQVTEIVTRHLVCRDIDTHYLYRYKVIHRHIGWILSYFIGHELTTSVLERGGQRLLSYNRVVSYTYIHTLTPFSHGGTQKLKNATCYDPNILLSPRPYS